MAPDTLRAELCYSWVPFTVAEAHFTFVQHHSMRLQRSLCSHWGPAVYKWEGPITTGPHLGKVGVLIGETGDLCKRIKQYVSGTQERGNKLWRDAFLTQGEMSLYTLELTSFRNSGREPIDPSAVLARANLRLVLEQLLVMQAFAEDGNSRWVVNVR
jgi:hypothetical protein